MTPYGPLPVVIPAPLIEGFDNQTREAVRQATVWRQCLDRHDVLTELEFYS